MVSLDRFSLDPQTAALEWHEAVAVVQEIATRHLAGAHVTARRPSDVSLDAEGRLTIPHAEMAVTARGALGVAREAQQVADLRSLLKALLPATGIPAALGALVEAPADGQVATVAELSKALGFFERPGRARDLKIIASRQVAQLEQLTLNEKLAELTRKTRHQEPQAVSPPPKPAPAPPLPPASEPTRSEQTEPGWEFLSETQIESTAVADAGVLAGLEFQTEAEQHRPATPKKPRFTMPAVTPAQLKQAAQLVAAAVLVLVAGVVAYATFTAITSGKVAERAGQPDLETASGSPDSAGTGGKGTSLEVERSSTAGARTNRRESRATAAATSRRTAPVLRGVLDRSKAEDDGGSSSESLAIALPPSLSERPGDMLPPLVQVAPRDPAAQRITAYLLSGRVDAAGAGADVVTVYDAQDNKVRPARLVRPQLPEVPPNTPPDTLGVFEFVVSMRGTVERIRLVRSPADGNYRDIMLMPAAKAWVFQPATRDGQPVRYRMQIQIPQ